MGTYKGIQGYMVESLASDPGTISEVIGKLWYNSGTNVWKIGVQAAGSWSTGGVLNNGRSAAVTSGDTTVATIATGQASPTPITKCETYNGTTWTEVNDVNTGRKKAGGDGTNTACFIAGGTTGPGSAAQVALTEIWNGTCWTEVNDLVASKYSCVGTGTTTAGLLFGDGQSESGETEEFDGTCWAEVNNQIAGRSDTQGNGTQTATFCAGGSPEGSSPPLAPTGQKMELYNGTCWTEDADLTNPRVSGSAAGTTTSGLIFGGYQSTQPAPTNTVHVEEWNGTGWTEVGNLATARTSTSGDGSTSNAIVAGGSTTVYLTNVEEWADPVYAAQTVTTS